MPGGIGVREVGQSDRESLERDRKREQQRGNGRRSKKTATAGRKRRGVEKGGGCEDRSVHERN